MATPKKRSGTEVCSGLGSSGAWHPVCAELVLERMNEFSGLRGQDLSNAPFAINLKSVDMPLYDAPGI